MTLFANSILRYYEHIYGYENKTETACVAPKKKRNGEWKSISRKEIWHIKAILVCVYVFASQKDRKIIRRFNPKKSINSTFLIHNPYLCPNESCKSSRLVENKNNHRNAVEFSNQKPISNAWNASNSKTIMPAILRWLK